MVHGALDRLVDRKAAQETAAYHGGAWRVHVEELEGLAHDAMLDARWRDAAQAVQRWLARLRDAAAVGAPS